MASPKVTDINWQGQEVDEATIEKREFRERGDQRYSLEISPLGITFEVDRLRRQSKELIGEVSVTVGPRFKGARGVNGVLTSGDLNLSSVQARSTRAKLLAERSKAEHLDWFGFVEEFVTNVIQAERTGKPAVVLADLVVDDDDADTWIVGDVPILKSLPMVLFGSGGAAKSYLAMWIAGSLAQQDIPVLYADWEFSAKDHRKRLGKLFQPMPKALYYVTCERPLVDEVDRLVRLVREHRCQYVVCDSMVFALNGPADDEHAGVYFRALRQLRVGSLNIAHTTKTDDDREKQVYGSVFFQNGARSIWFSQRADQSPHGELQIGLYHRKSNVGELLKPKGFVLKFSRDITRVERIAIDDVDELADKLPILDRMKRALVKGALTVKQLADDTNAPQPTIRKVLSRHKSLFVRIGTNKVGLASQDLEF